MTARSHNFSAYNKVRLTVKSENGSTPPDKISIQLVDSNAQYSLNLPSGFGGTPISSSTWTTYETNLSNFSGLDKSSIKQMNIIFEYGTPGVLPSVGTVYFDEIDFAQ